MEKAADARGYLADMEVIHDALIQVGREFHQAVEWLDRDSSKDERARLAWSLVISCATNIETVLGEFSRAFAAYREAVVRP